MIFSVIRLLFWVSLSGLLYTYFVYPIILLLVYLVVQSYRDLKFLTGRHDRRVLPPTITEAPAVTLIIPAHNEEEHLAEKIANLERIAYTRDKVEIIFVSDGSTDRTNEILKGISDSRVNVILLPERRGKASALNCAVSCAKHDILIFSDASTLFAENTIHELVRHFRSDSVGAVCGSLRFQAGPESEQTEGVYWHYESMLRLMEGRLGSTLTASGALYALRRRAYVPLAPDTVLDDFVTIMNARKLGLSIVYDPEAVGVDFPPTGVSGEFKRRVRLAWGSFCSLKFFLQVPLPWLTRFAFISHKLLRWLVPVMLLLLLSSNIVLLGSYSPSYAAIAAMQLGLYVWALVGFVFRKQVRRIPFAQLGYFLLAMNLALLLGLLRALTGRQQTTWEHAS